MVVNMTPPAMVRSTTRHAALDRLVLGFLTLTRLGVWVRLDWGLSQLLPAGLWNADCKSTLQVLGGPLARVLLKRGGSGPGTQKFKSLCTKNSQINIPFLKISFCPTMKSGSEGVGGATPPPPPREPLSC